MNKIACVAVLLVSDMLFSISFPASAQEQVQTGSTTIRGGVRTAGGVSVPGAAVRLLHVTSGETWETATDEAGLFSVSGIPAGHYRIEARQLGLGIAIWDDEIIAGSAENAARTIQLTLDRAKSLEKPLPTGRPVVASTGIAAVSLAQPAEMASMQTSVMPEPSASGQKISRRSKKKGFEQVETTGILTASTDLAEQAAPDSGSTQSSSAESYLISGAVGRGSTAEATDAIGQDDSLAVADTSSGSGKRRKGSRRSGSGSSGAISGAADNLAGGAADLAVRDKIKHLGSNQVRLTLNDFLDTSAWDAHNYALTGVQSPKLSRYSERFSANIGGPLTIPKLYDGKDRTFWFANYQLTRRTDTVNQFKNLPTASERNGNFCDRGAQLFDPLTGVAGPRQPFGCAIPVSRLDPAALKLASFYPLPNLPGVILNYDRALRTPASMDVGNFRLLHTISPRFSVVGIYNLVQANNGIVTAFPSLSGTRGIRDQSITVGLTQNWTPRLINETKVNFNRSRNRSLSSNAFNTNIAAQAGVTGISNAPIDFGLPLITFSSITELADPSALLVRNQTARISDNISYTLRRHTLRGGAEIRRRQLNSVSDPKSRGVYNFSGLMTSQLNPSGASDSSTGIDFADFLLGLPETTTVQFGATNNYGRSWQAVSYLQDDWRVKPRFSVNFGLRYELYTPFVEKNNHLASLLVNSSITQVAVAIPGQTNPFGGRPLPNSLIRPHYANFAPRFGLAWRPLSHGGPVVRAGYGMFYNGAIYDGLYTSMLNQPPWAQSRTLVTSTTQLLTLENGFPASRPDAVPNIYGADPNYKVGYAQIWNFSFEQQLGRSYVFELLYTGTKGTHLDLLYDPNQAAPGSIIGSDQRRRIPNAPGFSYETSGADSIYNGVQVRAQRRMSNGLRLLFLYTLGHSIDDTSVIGVGHISGLVQDYNNLRGERGNSFFDIRHDIRASFFYDLPFGGRRHWLRSGMGAKLFGNWQLSASTVINSGNHLTPFITAQNSSGVGPLFSQRPDQLSDPNLPSSQRSNGHFFNVSAFALPQPGTFGNAARGTIVGPGLFNVNASFGRRMHFGPENRYQFELRWEVQNATNTANFSNLVTVVDAHDAGVVTGAKNMRSMDMMLRLHF